MSRPDFDTRTASRRIVASYPSYDQAERAVDYLSDHEFPVAHTAIAGRDLQFLEQVTGRLTTPAALGRSAVSGAVAGALFGWVFGLFNWITPLVAGLLLVLYGAVFGAVVGGLVGLLTHATSGSRRDFDSVPTFQASAYDVLVDAEVADQAAELLRAAGAPGLGRAGARS